MRTGLNLEELRAIRGKQHLGVKPLLTRIEHHLQTQEGYVAFSGGKDSLVVLDLARQVDPAVPVVFFDSGLEYPQTYTYLEQLTGQWRLNLDVIPAQPSLLELLVAGGRWDHHQNAGSTLRRGVSLHETLISWPAAIAHQRYGPGELWGVRSAESTGRRIAYARVLADAGCACATACETRQERREHHGGRIARADGTVAFGPIWDWPTPHVWEYIAARRLPVNPAYAVLRAIGAPPAALRVSHLLDGHGIEHGRALWLRRGWPGLFDELATLLPRLREFA